MSLVSIFKSPKSGGSTVAAEVGLLLYRHVHKGGRRRKPLAIATEPTSGAALAAAGLPVERARTLNRIASKIGGASRVAVLDTVTAPYEQAIASFRADESTQREKYGLGRSKRMSPEAWAEINEKYRASIYGAAEAAGVDLVEVHRQGPVMRSDAEHGVVETSELRGRGFAEAGVWGDLTLVCEGGLRGFRVAGERVLRVLADGSHKVTGKEIILPDLRSPADRNELRSLLQRLLLPSLLAIQKAKAEDFAAWADLSETPDTWASARAGAEQAEVERIASAAKALLTVNGLMGMTGEAKAERAELLLELFGVGTVDHLDRSALNIGALQVALASLEARLADRRSHAA